MTVKLIAGVIDHKKPMLLYSSLFDSGTVTQFGATSDGNALNCLEDTTFDSWTGANATARMTVDCGSATYADCVAIDAHDLYTNGATVSVEYSSDNSTWVPVWTCTPTDNTTIIGAWPVVKYHYWRVSVTNGPASIGVMRLGRRLIIPTGVLSGHVAINHAERIEILSNMSDSGHFIGTIKKSTGADITVDFGLVDREFVETYMVDFEDHYNNGKPFFYAGSLSVFPKDIGFCLRVGDELRPSYQEGAELMPIQLDVKVFVNDQ